VEAAPVRPLAVGALVHHGAGAAALPSRPWRLTPPEDPSVTPGHHRPGVSLPAPGARRAEHHAETIKHDTHRRRTTTATPVLQSPTPRKPQPAVTIPDRWIQAASLTRRPIKRAARDWDLRSMAVAARRRSALACHGAGAQVARRGQPPTSYVDTRPTQAGRP
jgi:hypothetical protein